MNAPAPRILLVEDDPVIRDLVTDVLSSRGWQVLACAHLPDAVDVAQLRPEAVVLDLRLPSGRDGADLLAEMRATPGARLIPVVVCTGDGLRAEADAARFAALGAAVVIKPFDLDDLVGAVTANVGARFNRLRMAAAPAADGPPR